MTATSSAHVSQMTPVPVNAGRQSKCRQIWQLFIRRPCHDFIEDLHPPAELFHGHTLVGRVLSGVHFRCDFEAVEPVAGNPKGAVHLALSVSAAQRWGNNRLRIVLVYHLLNQPIEACVRGGRVGRLEAAGRRNPDGVIRQQVRSWARNTLGSSPGSNRTSSSA